MKMKKCTSLLLALLILVSNVGLAVNVHYCGGQIAGISSVYAVSDISNHQNEAEKSCCAVDSGKKSCCDNKVIKVEKKSDVVVKIFSFQIDSPIIIQNWNPIVFVPKSKIAQPQTAAYYCDAHAPPLYRLYSQYIFYA
jgi:hypothetical protein